MFRPNFKVDSATAPLRDQRALSGDLPVCCVCVCVCVSEFGDINETRRSVLSGGIDITSHIIKTLGTSHSSLDSSGEERAAAQGSGVYFQQFSSRCY